MSGASGGNGAGGGMQARDAMLENADELRGTVGTMRMPVRTQTQSNTVEHAGQSSPAAASSATSGGAQSTATNPSGYASDPVAEVKNSKEYQDVKSALDTLQEALDDNAYAWLEETYQSGLWGFTCSDGNLTLDEVKFAARQTEGDRNMDSSVVRFAKYLASHRELFSQIDTDSDGSITRQDILAFIADGKKKLQDMESAARSPAGAQGNPQPTAVDQAVPLTGATVTPQTNSSQQPAGADHPVGSEQADAPTNDPKTPDGPPPPPPKAPPSGKSGVEGASENLANGVDWLQQQIMDLSNYAQQHPEEANALQGRITILNNQMQAMLNMQNQLMTMMSNMSKMFSDIAMNAIRNMR